LANAVSSCSASYQCIISSCNSGYANCDSNATNGCETQLGTTSNCASCGNACSTGQTCNSNGVCVGNSNPPPRGGAIIIDHTTTDISKIPACWIEKAKAITLQYAHRSDGGNLLQGLDYLYSANSALKYGLKVDSLPSQTNPIQLRIMDGNPPMSSYSYPDQYWDSAEARVATEANWASGQFDVSMWSWCSEFDVGSSGASETAALAQLYLTTMNSMEADYPNIKFVYMTSYTNNGNSYLVADNQLIRDYAKNNNKILYDFEDIGKCDPSGYCYSGADRACTWCTSWCTSHPSDCVNLPSCGHADATNGGLICVQRSKALWWLMARLAGWDGNPSDGC
jgi:hypothetical protein